MKGSTHGYIMADGLEEKPNTFHDFHITKAAIFDTFNNWKKWREEQLQEFRNKQFLENQRLQRLSSESQNKFQQLLENGTKCLESEEKSKTPVPDCSDASSVSLMKDFDNCDSVQDLSITGHLQRCFDDSDQSNISVKPNKVPSVANKIPVFSEIRNPQFPAKNVSEKKEQLVNDDATNDPSVKPKRPFLKKGTGLLRYMSKSAVGGQVTKPKVTPKSNNFPQKKNIHVPQKTLNLKPAIRKTGVSSENVKHIRFDIPLSDGEEKSGYLTEDDLSPASKFVRTGENKYNEQNKSNLLSSTSPECNPSEDSRSEQCENENLNLLKENEELEEFEMLEDCAQNSSFNSDSSIVQRILHGDSNKPPDSNQRITMKPLVQNIIPVHKEIHKSSLESMHISDKIGLNKFHEEVQARKQVLQKVISDINPRIQSLQKEITSSKQDALDDSDASERCSTPVGNSSSEEIIPTSPTSENGSRNDAQEKVCQYGCRGCDVDSDFNSDQGSIETIRNDEEESISEVPTKLQEKDMLDGKHMIREKLFELQKEIDTYQELNTKLSSMCKERDEILRKLQKERETFNKHKEAEKKKLEAELEEERRQIKRQKDTFSRYQKLRKDHPTRKEREEINGLRQEVEQLQEELKRQKIKYASDSRRWKSRVEAFEKERDTFKLENIRLEEQCQDLLAALKARMNKKPESKSFNHDGGDAPDNIMTHSPLSKDVAIQTQAKDLNSDIIRNSIEIVSRCSDINTARTEVHCNLVPEHDNIELHIPEESDSNTKDHCPDEVCPSSKSNLTSCCNKPGNGVKDVKNDNMSVISVSVDSEVKEIDHGDRIEKIFPSGEREIIFHSGTRKVISADGKLTKFLFYNGDEKEIFSDKREVYRYASSGVIEKIFPDGQKITEHPNGQTHHRFSDGHKDIKFPNGEVHKIYPDGSVHIHSTDGTVIKLCADGTKVTEFANGQKEIKTDTYKRREFPDGSIKILYNSGRRETRFSNGRIKIKDKEGKVLFDTKYIATSKDRTIEK